MVKICSALLLLSVVSAQNCTEEMLDWLHIHVKLNQDSHTE
jgi:hypothetical protein